MDVAQGTVHLTRTLLLDADIIAYQAAASNEEKIDWGDDIVTVKADMDGATSQAAKAIENLVVTLDADAVIVCLSDDVNNFRKGVLSSYKGNRTGERPTLLYDVKEWLAENYPTDRRPYLEADDVMGILATEPHEGERIIVSEDKDMLTIPAPLYRPHKAILGVVTPTPEEAERFMFWQALTGDATDGYKGCPDIGPAKADRILDGEAWHVTHREITRGKRKGQIETKWSLGPSEAPLWERIVSAYEKAGLEEADAVIQVNLARILKHSDFDGSRPIPWVPN